MNEWVHTAPPEGYYGPLSVWMDNDQLREVVRSKNWYGYEFTDCNHPMQNVICDTDLIKAWKIKDMEWKI